LSFGDLLTYARTYGSEAREAHLKKRTRFHAIRHSYAVAVLKATKNLEAVRRLLGHGDYTTIKVYLDLTQEDLEQELSKLFS
jgi:site-specific recombinase XerD